MTTIKETDGYLIDGFPRQMDQAIKFEKQVMPCKFVLFFDCPESLMELRLIKRGETSGRADDNAETIRKRFKTFQQTSMPVIEYFEKSGRVRKVSADGTMDEVYRHAAACFEGFGNNAQPAGVAYGILEKLPSKTIVFVLGGPGTDNPSARCGKGTNCARLAVEFELKHLSTGDLLRAEVASGNELGRQLEATMKEGAMVPLEITLKLLKQAMLSSGPTNGYLIDGFPRQIEQAMEFEKQVRDCTRHYFFLLVCGDTQMKASSRPALCRYWTQKVGPPTSVLYFECPEALMMERLVKRGETSGRADDNVETIKKRFATFMQESLPVVEHYKKLRKIVSSAAPKEEVYMAARLPFVAASGISVTKGNGAESVGVDTGPNVVFVLGGPGSGKGTQCDRIVKTLGFAHLSTGDLLRAEVAKGTEMGQMLEATMKEGKMVRGLFFRFNTTLTLLTNAVKSRAAEVPSPRGFLVDGFPRTVEQAEAFEKSVGCGRFALFFTCPAEVLVNRLLKRGETSGRADDNLESIKKRIDTFNDVTMPVAEYFKRDGRLKEVRAGTCKALRGPILGRKPHRDSADARINI
ncbi:MAG: adenylate kinase-domain-containing protein, partial [Olpidium bornovanus]